MYQNSNNTGSDPGTNENLLTPGERSNEECGREETISAIRRESEEAVTRIRNEMSQLRTRRRASKILHVL